MATGNSASTECEEDVITIQENFLTIEEIHELISSPVNKKPLKGKIYVKVDREGVQPCYLGTKGMVMNFQSISDPRRVDKGNTALEFVMTPEDTVGTARLSNVVTNGANIQTKSAPGDTKTYLQVQYDENGANKENGANEEDGSIEYDVAFWGDGDIFDIDGPPGEKLVAIHTINKDGKDFYLCPNVKKGKIVAKQGSAQYVFYIPHDWKFKQEDWKFKQEDWKFKQETTEVQRNAQCALI